MDRLAVTSLPIIESADGVTLLSTWLILIDEVHGFALKAATRSTDSERAFRFNLTVTHEVIHFLQGVTCALPYSYSANLLSLCGSLMRDARDGRLDAPTFADHRRRYRDLGGLLNAKSNGISTIDLLEGMAVVESFRTVTRELNTRAFTTYLDRHFSETDSPYRRIIDVLNQEFNLQTALEMTAPVCFLSLNGDVPPNSFWSVVQAMRKVSAPWRLPATTLARLAGMDYRASLLNTFEIGGRHDFAHKILSPYIEHLSSLGTLEERFKFAARPSDWLRGEGPSGAEKLMPPFVLYSGGVGERLGLANDWSEEQQFMFMDATAMVGACQLLLSDVEPDTVCPHSECPVHQTRMCHAWYAIPQGQDWSVCKFDNRFRLQFGASPKSLLEFSRSVGEADVIWTPPEEFLPVMGKPIEKYRTILNEASQLQDPEEWDRVVAKLLFEAHVQEIDFPLLENVSYLVASVSGYLLDMVGQIQSNPFNDWMADRNRRFRSYELSMIREVASQIGVNIGPLFGLTILRALETILTLDVTSPSQPVWLQDEIRAYATLANR